MAQKVARISANAAGSSSIGKCPEPSITWAGVRAGLGPAEELGVNVDRQASAVDLPTVNRRVKSLALAQSAARGTAGPTKEAIVGRLHFAR